MKPVYINTEKITLALNKEEINTQLDNLTFKTRFEQIRINNFIVGCKNQYYNNTNGTYDSTKAEFFKQANIPPYAIYVSYDFGINNNIYTFAETEKYTIDEVRDFLKNIFLNENNLKDIINHLEEYHQIHKVITSLKIERNEQDTIKENSQRVLISDKTLIDKIKNSNKKVKTTEITINEKEYMLINIKDIPSGEDIPNFNVSNRKEKLKLVQECTRCGCAVYGGINHLPEDTPFGLSNPVCDVCFELNNKHYYLIQEMYSLDNAESLIPRNSEKAIQILKYLNNNKISQ